MAEERSGGDDGGTETPPDADSPPPEEARVEAPAPSDGEPGEEESDAAESDAAESDAAESGAEADPPDGETDLAVGDAVVDLSAAAPEGVDAPAAAPAEEPAEPLTVAGIAERAHRAQRAWAKTPVHKRVGALRPLKKRILSRAEEIARTVAQDVGKPIEEAALAEVIPNADLVSYWCDVIEELLDAAPVELDPLAYPSKKAHIRHDPRGVVALITPWNYPIAIPLRTLVPALLSGNAVVCKPSEVTPACGALLESLFEGLLPPGVVSFVHGDGEVGRELCEADVDLVVFTGSVTTGRAVARVCAERLIPCSLELGGKDAAIVLPDCFVDRTAHGLVWGAFTNAGQNCASVERVYVDTKIADRLIKRMVAITRTLGPTELSDITTDAQLAKVKAHLADAVARGAEVLVGGEPEPGSRTFPPTIVKIPPGTDEGEMLLLSEETFGPILPVVVVEGVEDAIARVNASRYALTTSVWTKATRKARAYADELRSGVVTINNHGFTAALPAAPWTGTGDSGYGITNSPHTLASLTRARFLLEDRNRARELWWYPYTPALRKLVFAMARLRGGAGFFGRIAAFFTVLFTLPRRFKRG